MDKFLKWLQTFGITGKQAASLAGKAKIKKVKLPGIAGKILGKSERAPLMLLNQKMMFDPTLVRYSTGTVGLDGRYYHLLREYELVNAEIARTAKYLFENKIKMNKTERLNWESAVDKWKRTQKELNEITKKFEKQNIKPQEAFNNYEKKITEGRHQGDAPLPITVEDLQYEMDFLRRSAQELSTSSREELRRLGMLDERGEVNFGEYLRRQLTDATGRTTRSLSESYHRAAVRPFLIKQHEAGKIKLSEQHYNQLKNAADLNSGGSNRLVVVDPVAVFKYHYGEGALNKIPSGLNDMNVYTKDGTKELVKMFEDAGIKVKNKASAGDSSKYLSKEYIYEEIERIDDAMQNIRFGDDPFWEKMTNAEKQHTLDDLYQQSLRYQEVLSVSDLPREVKLRSLLEEGKKKRWRNQTNLKEQDLVILETGTPTDEHIDFLYEVLFRGKKFDPKNNQHVVMREEILENLPDVYTKSQIEGSQNIESLYYSHVQAGDIKNASISQKPVGSVTIETITPKDTVPPKKKPELTLLSKEDMDFQATLKRGLTKEFKEKLKLTNMTDKDLDFIFKDVKKGQTFEESYATIMKNAKEFDKRKKGRIYKDEKGDTKGIAIGWSESELKQLDEAMKTGIAESEAMKAAGLDPSKAADALKWDEMQKIKNVTPKVKKDRPNIRIMKNYERELTDIELAKEGYTLQEIDILKKARNVMKKENQNPNDALAWVRGEMADDAGIEFEEFMTEFDWGDFPGDTNLAQGGRVGYQAGTHPLVPAELSSMLVRLRNVVEGSGMYANFSQRNRKSLQISLTSQINALLGN